MAPAVISRLVAIVYKRDDPAWAEMTLPRMAPFVAGLAMFAFGLALGVPMLLHLVIGGCCPA